MGTKFGMILHEKDGFPALCSRRRRTLGMLEYQDLRIKALTRNESRIHDVQSFIYFEFYVLSMIYLLNWVVEKRKARHVFKTSPNLNLLLS